MMYTTQLLEDDDYVVSEHFKIEMDDLINDYGVNLMLTGHQHSVKFFFFVSYKILTLISMKEVVLYTNVNVSVMVKLLYILLLVLLGLVLKKVDSAISLEIGLWFMLKNGDIVDSLLILTLYLLNL